MAEDAELQGRLEAIYKKFGTELKCKSLKLSHLVSDIESLGLNPTEGAIEIVCEKYNSLFVI